MRLVLVVDDHMQNGGMGSIHLFLLVYSGFPFYHSRLSHDIKAPHSLILMAKTYNVLLHPKLGKKNYTY